MTVDQERWAEAAVVLRQKARTHMSSWQSGEGRSLLLATTRASIAGRRSRSGFRR